MDIIYTYIYIYDDGNDNSCYVCFCLSLCSSHQASMAAIYYEKIDVEGHHFGPDSYQVKTAVQQLDLVMQQLNRKVKVSRYVTAVLQSLFLHIVPCI